MNNVIDAPEMQTGLKNKIFNRFLSLNIFIMVIILILVSGCGNNGLPRGNEEKIFLKYVKHLEKQEYDKAYKMLSFAHLPGMADEKAFIMAQKMGNINIAKRDYKILSKQLRKNLAILDIEIISEYENPKGSLVKQLTQVYIIEDNGKKILPGTDKNKNKIFDVLPHLADDTLQLSPDRLFIFRDGIWDERTQFDAINQVDE